MAKPRQKPTAQDILNELNGMWVDKKGITIVGNCCDNKAYAIMNEIREQVRKEKNKELPKKIVPSEYVIRYFNININYLKKISK